MYIPFLDVYIGKESRVWIHENEETPTMTKKQQVMKKIIYVILHIHFFSRLVLRNNILCSYSFSFTEKCLPEVFSRVPEKAIILHHDNASYHTAGITLQNLAKNRI